ncbi:MAG: GNAT family N-acetyltransferase [Alphaproteobacteria bacterium]
MARPSRARSSRVDGAFTGKRNKKVMTVRPPPFSADHSKPRDDSADGRARQAIPRSAAAAGYASPVYAQALSEFGTPLLLSGSGGWLLKRGISGSAVPDAMGCYPVFACPDWSGLREDLAALKEELVSITLVADPFGNHSGDLLRDCFPDLCTRYKEHYVVDLDRLAFESISSHHRRNVRRGLREVEVEFCPDPEAHLDNWNRLYKELVTRHGITGIAAFSRNSFRKQMRVPGLKMQRAVHRGETVGMVLWFVDRGVAWYHLGAYSERGYRLRASYALFWAALEHFSGRIETAALGAAAGATPGGGGGLDRFKAGWATGTRPAFLCGRILSPERYAALSAAQMQAGGYFPAYRAGEFR